MADAAYQHYPQHMEQHQYDAQQQHYYQQQQQLPPQQQHQQQLAPYGHQGMPNGMPQQHHMQQQMPPQQLPPPQQQLPPPQQVPEQVEGQPGDEFGGNPIPMSQAQLATLLEGISHLDTQRIILEPGVMIGETGHILNLNVIRTKVNSAAYTLPEMLVDLNSICEPFLNQGPDHASYATQFLDQANQAIVDAVRDAQFAANPGQQSAAEPGYGGPPPPQQQQQGYMMPPEGNNGYADAGSHMPPGAQQGHSGWMAEVVGGDERQGVMDPNGGYMNGRMVPYGQGGPGRMGMGSPPEGGKKKGMKRGPDGPLSPDKEKRPNSGSSARPRLEGRRCQVCAVIKKAGCGTDNAHFRCLKKKKPDIAIELEKRVGELKDVGEEERVTVWNPKEGRKLSGQAAPMLKNLAGWLASHPGWEAHPRVTTGSSSKSRESEGSPQLGSATPQPPQVLPAVHQSPMIAPQQLHQQFQAQDVDQSPQAGGAMGDQVVQYQQTPPEQRGADVGAAPQHQMTPSPQQGQQSQGQLMALQAVPSDPSQQQQHMGNGQQGMPQQQPMAHAGPPPMQQMPQQVMVPEPAMGYGGSWEQQPQPPQVQAQMG